MEVRKVDTENSREVEQFVMFPFKLYGFCSQWVPPLISAAKSDLNRHVHPFYKHSTAEFFLAQSCGQTLGRIAAIYHRNYNDYHGTRTAFFGFFEVVEDVQVARALFDAAIAWARAQGADQILGPRGLIGTDGGGVLVEGFEFRPAMGAAYNLPYYDRFMQDSGLEKDRDLLSVQVDRGPDLPERFFEAAERIKARRGLWVKNFRSKRELRQWVPQVIKAHGEAFSKNYTYYPPTPDEAALVADLALRIADPRFVKLVMKGEQVAGVVLGLPDLTAGLQRAKGRLWPLGWLHLLAERSRTRWVDFPALGLLPKYQGMGANVILYTELATTLKPSHFDHAELVQVDEHNFRSLREIENLNAIWHKKHRLYRRALLPQGVAAIA